MTVPYDLVVSIGGMNVKKQGYWQGIPSSVIRYKIGLLDADYSDVLLIL